MKNNVWQVNRAGESSDADEENRNLRILSGLFFIQLYFSADLFKPFSSQPLKKNLLTFLSRPFLSHHHINFCHHI